MISIHSLLTENELAEEFAAAFAARRLAEKFFYWFPLSVRAWLALCSDGAYRNFVRSNPLIAQSAGNPAATGPIDRQYAGRVRSHRRSPRAARPAAARRPAARGRRDLLGRADRGRLRQSAEPPLRLGPTPRRGDP